MIDASAAYTEVMDRLCLVLSGPPDEHLDTPVPACPGWSVRDVVAHHCGVVVDVASGSLDDLLGLDLLQQWRDADVARARDDLTARQVAERRGRSLGSVITEWREAIAALAPMLRGEQPFPNGVPAMFGAVVVNDVVVHEGDIRYALGLEPAPDGPALSLALAGYGFSFDQRLREVGLPPVVLEYDGKQRQLGGDGVAGATLRSTRFDLVRILASRRASDEILSYDWAGDPRPYVPILPEYGPTTTSDV